MSNGAIIAIVAIVEVAIRVQIKRAIIIMDNMLRTSTATATSFDPVFLQGIGGGDHRKLRVPDLFPPLLYPCGGRPAETTAHPAPLPVMYTAYPAEVRVVSMYTTCSVYSYV